MKIGKYCSISGGGVPWMGRAMVLLLRRKQSMEPRIQPICSQASGPRVVHSTRASPIAESTSIDHHLARGSHHLRPSGHRRSHNSHEAHFSRWMITTTITTSTITTICDRENGGGERESETSPDPDPTQSRPDPDHTCSSLNALG